MRFRWLFIFSLLFLLRLIFLKIPEYPAGETVRVIARLKSEPYLSGSYQVITLDDLIIFTEPFPKFLYGDKIEVVGKLQKRLTGNDQEQFCLYFPQISLIDHGDAALIWVKFRRLLIIFRHHLERKIAAVLPEPHSSLLVGILLGTRMFISEEFWQSLQTTGTIHLVAASGFNITVVAGTLISLFTLILPRRKALPLALAGIIIYTFMAGAGPAVVRAAIMGSLTYIAQFMGRERQAIRALLISAGLMLFMRPLILLDRGFQLSFCATAGILFLLPLLERISFIGRNWLGKEVGLTLAAQISVLPILLYHFKTIGILSPLVNGLVGPLIPFIMKFGGVIIVLALISENIARIISIPAWILLSVMIKIINAFGKIMWSNLQIRIFPLWAVGTYYFILLMLVFLLRKKEKKFISRYK